MDDLELLPKVSAYDEAYMAAKREITNVLLDLQRKHGLTAPQLVSILAGEIQSEIGFVMKAEKQISIDSLTRR